MFAIIINPVMPYARKISHLKIDWIRSKKTIKSPNFHGCIKKEKVISPEYNQKT